MTLREYPDRLPEDSRALPSVTSDGLLTVLDRAAAADWAVDVMVMAAPSEHRQFADELHRALNPMALKHGLELKVVGQFKSIAEVNDLIHQVTAAVWANQLSSVSLRGARAQWSPSAPNRPGELVLAVLPPPASPALADQLYNTISTPLKKKITNQAARAQAAGCRTAVLLDGAGHQDVAQGTHWLHQHPHTVQVAADRILREARGRLDAIAYLERNATWHLLHGDV